MSGGTEQPQIEVLEGVIMDVDILHETAFEQQRFVNLTHAMVFLKRDAYLAEICARKAYRLMREHLRECFRALVAREHIYCSCEYDLSSERSTGIIDL